ncbi:MAG: adenylate/guanylate cyclase domain-containing protein [Gaiellaceae bacterium]
MPRAVTRRLATVLFLDIVGSTALATELGDARWRELVTRFRRVVRAELKRFGGREQDTAGDGFFATFTEPAQALRAVAEIATAVQALGIDVRTGVHTGECEEIDGKLGGIAVHVGARVMGMAGPAQVLVTGTVRDLVSGSGATFEDRGTHELKGLDESRHVFELTAVETRLPPPLTPEEAAARLEHVVPSRISSRARAVALVAAVVLIAVTAAGGWLAFRGGGAEAAQQIDLVRIDPQTTKIAEIVHGTPVGRNLWENLWEDEGTLWQMQRSDTGQLVSRNIRTGAIGNRIDLGADACKCKVAFGFGSVWLAKERTVLSGPHTGATAWSLERIDKLSGRRTKTFKLPGDGGVSRVAAGNGAVWVLQPDTTLLRIDPVTNRITGKWKTNAVETEAALVPLAGYVWICECQVSQVRRFDPRTGRSRTFTIPTQAFLVDVDRSRLWFLDPMNSTVTPMDPETGETGSPVGLSGQPQQAVIAYGSAWIAAGPHVERIDLLEGRRTQIPMPARVFAGGIAADTETHAIWVSNSVRGRRPDE